MAASGSPWHIKSGIISCRRIAKKLFLKVDGLHEGKSGFVSQGPLEWQTHYFASALLMRLHQFREALDQARNGFTASERLARDWHISITAMAICYTFFTDELPAISSSGDRLDYCFMSEQIRDLRGITWIKKGIQMPDGARWRFDHEATKIEQTWSGESRCRLDERLDGAPDIEANKRVVGLRSCCKTLTFLFTSEIIDDDDEPDDDWTPVDLAKGCPQRTTLSI